MLLTLLLIPITVGCRSVPKREIVLPPKPQREVLPEVHNIQDVSLLITYYESLVQSWENWGDKVEKIIGDCE